MLTSSKIMTKYKLIQIQFKVNLKFDFKISEQNETNTTIIDDVVQ